MNFFSRFVLLQCIIVEFKGILRDTSAQNKTWVKLGPARLLHVKQNLCQKFVFVWRYHFRDIKKCFQRSSKVSQHHGHLQN